MRMLDTICKAFENNENSVEVFFDHEHVFDTVLIVSIYVEFFVSLFLFLSLSLPLSLSLSLSRSVSRSHSVSLCIILFLCLHLFLLRSVFFYVSVYVLHLFLDILVCYMSLCLSFCLFPSFSLWLAVTHTHTHTHTHTLSLEMTDTGLYVIVINAVVTQTLVKFTTHVHVNTMNLLKPHLVIHESHAVVVCEKEVKRTL